MKIFICIIWLAITFYGVYKVCAVDIIIKGREICIPATIIYKNKNKVTLSVHDEFGTKNEIRFSVLLEDKIGKPPMFLGSVSLHALTGNIIFSSYPEEYISIEKYGHKMYIRIKNEHTIVIADNQIVCGWRK